MIHKQSTSELLDLILMVSLTVREKIKAQSAQHQLSIIHLWTLKFVAEQTNPSMRDVATFLNISPPSATSFIETLIKGGYLARELDASDRRVVRIVLSQSGEALYRQIIQDVRAKLGLLVESLSPEEQRGLETALTALTKQLKDK